MKLIDKKTLLQMPRGTVFAKKSQTCCETNPVLVLRNCMARDFTYVNVSSFDFGKSYTENDEAFFTLEEKPGTSIEMHLSEQRDGLFEDDEMYYVFSKNEVQQMIDVLTGALKTGY